MNNKIAISVIIFLIISCTQKGHSPTNPLLKYSKSSSPYKIGSINACLPFADPSTSNRCEAVKNCVESGEKFFNQKIQENPQSEAMLLQELSKLYASHEPTLYQAIVKMKRSSLLYKKSGNQKMYLSTLAKLGMLQLRLAEVRNCVTNHNQDSCHFPLSENAIHKDKEGSLAAIQTFLTFLETEPKNKHIRWLLNIAHMTLGTHPTGVPSQYLIDSHLFQSKMKFKKFTDIAGALGLQTVYQQSGGAVFDDFDNDGDLDIILTSRGYCDSAVYFQNNGKEGFTNKSVESGLASEFSAGHLIQADYDNDGDLDLYLTRGAWDYLIYHQDILKKSQVYSSLLENNGKGVFTNVTKKSGLMSSGPNTVVAAHWSDFNNDGHLDLFVCNELREPDLYINNGKKKFINKIKSSGIKNMPNRCKGIAVGDINSDGYPDIYISNYLGENKLYLNQKDLTFIDTASTTIKKYPFRSFPAFMFDFNNDGNLDIYSSVFSHRIDHYVKQLLGGRSRNAETPKLFLGNGKGKFQDITKKANHSFTNMSMGINFGDLNNDGFDEIFIGSGHTSFGDITPNHMFYNNQGKELVDITTAGNFGNLQKGHGISFADFDRDGDQDILVQMGGNNDGDRFYPLLYQNPGFNNNWINIKFEGITVNKSAIGTKVKVSFRENGVLRHVYKWVNSGSSFGTNSLEVEVGIGKTKLIHSIEVWWSGQSKSFIYNNIAPNKFYLLKEGSDPVIRDLKKIEFKKSKHHHGHHHHHH